MRASRAFVVLSLATLLVVNVSAYTMGDPFKNKHVQNACNTVNRPDAVTTSTIIKGDPKDADWEADDGGSECKAPMATKVRTSKTFKTQKCKKNGANWVDDGAETAAKTIRACAKADGTIGHLRWQDLAFRFEKTSTLLRHNN
eukprot:TRINITY_DN29377_c0_g1_i1.p1 TRINITY_DN29377_c0_g1~~TRINITY_DN29377_c0_g1_i1.p1  ORF type:complete len:143 (-),score=29.61 TRINITY_DN29377_c0_g1_i1:403-831(-)